VSCCFLSKSSLRISEEPHAARCRQRGHRREAGGADGGGEDEVEAPPPQPWGRGASASWTPRRSCSTRVSIPLEVPFPSKHHSYKPRHSCKLKWTKRVSRPPSPPLAAPFEQPPSTFQPELEAHVDADHHQHHQFKTVEHHGIKYILKLLNMMYMQCTMIY
jgi:hypothetical protein